MREAIAAHGGETVLPYFYLGAMGGASMLCLCTTLGQDGLTARLLVVHSGCLMTPCETLGCKRMQQRRATITR